MRLMILDQDKILCFHRRDEGELWSLNFEGRFFVVVGSVGMGII